MPAKSEKQRKMMAIAEHQPDKLYARNKGVLKMSKSQLSDFASKRTDVYMMRRRRRNKNG